MKGGIPAFTAEEILDGIYYIHNVERKKKAREVDNAMTSRLTNNPFEWLHDPNRYDWMGIDTIQRNKPSGYTRAKGRDASKKLKRVEYGLF